MVGTMIATIITVVELLIILALHATTPSPSPTPVPYDLFADITATIMQHCADGYKFIIGNPTTLRWAIFDTHDSKYVYVTCTSPEATSVAEATFLVNGTTYTSGELFATVLPNYATYTEDTLPYSLS